jgi:hypothetical protein
MRASPATMDKVQAHLKEVARLLRGSNLLASDWAEDIEATAHAIQKEHDEKIVWNRENADKIRIIRDNIKTLSDKYGLKLSKLETEFVIEDSVADYDTESDIERIVLQNMVHTLNDKIDLDKLSEEEIAERNATTKKMLNKLFGQTEH